MLSVRDVVAADPGGRRHTIIKRTKNLVMAEDTEERLDHAKSLVTQVNEDAAVLWSEVVQSLPPESLFSMIPSLTMLTYLCGGGKQACPVNVSFAARDRHCMSSTAVR